MDLPREIQHPYHLIHTLTLREDSSYRTRNSTDIYSECRACHWRCHGLIYGCDKCNFYLDIECASLQLPSISYQGHHYHEHLLSLRNYILHQSVLPAILPPLASAPFYVVWFATSIYISCVRPYHKLLNISESPPLPHRCRTSRWFSRRAFIVVRFARKKETLENVFTTIVQHAILW